MNKEKDLKFIKEFSKISVNSICRENGIHTQNVYTGKVGQHTAFFLRTLIEEKINDLYKGE